MDDSIIYYMTQARPRFLACPGGWMGTVSVPRVRSTRLRGADLKVITVNPI